MGYPITGGTMYYTSVDIWKLKAMWAVMYTTHVNKKSERNLTFAVDF